MPHKSGKKSYPPKKGHPGKKNGMMMSKKDMEKQHKKKMMK